MKARIGFKVTGQSYQDGIGDFYHKLIAARCPVGVMSIDAAGPCWEVQQLAKAAGYSPADTFIHFRRTGIIGSRFIDVPNYDTSPILAAEWDWRTHNDLWKESPELDPAWVWYGINNELRKEASEWVAEYSIYLCSIALAAGKKITVMDWSAGTPDLDAWTKPKMQELLALLRAHPDKLALGLHEYSLETDTLESPWLVGRWKSIPGIKGVSVFFTEFGWAERGAPAPDVGMGQLLSTYAAHYAYPEVKGLALWTLDRGWGDIHQNISQYIPVLAQVIQQTEIPPRVLDGGQEGKMTVIGPDISKWQGNVDFNKMKVEGAQFVMARASYGYLTGLHEDQRIAGYIPLIRAAGLPYGLYHYYYPSIDPIQQMEFFFNLIVKYGGPLGVAVDLEEGSNIPGDYTDRVMRAMDYLHDKLKGIGHPHEPAIYTSPSYWTGTLKSPSWGAEYPLWLAQWTVASSPAVPKPWANWLFWQYTNAEPGPEWGVQSSRLDMNRFNGTEQDLADLVGADQPTRRKAIVVLLPSNIAPKVAGRIAEATWGGRHTIVYSFDDMRDIMDSDGVREDSQLIVYGYGRFSPAEKEIIKGYNYEVRPLDPFLDPPKEDPPSQPGNLLKNGSFDEGWTDIDQSNQNPNGWTVQWAIGEDNPYSADAWNDYQGGEFVHKGKLHLPASERDIFIWHGQQALKTFAGGRSIWARLSQTLPGMAAGRYRLLTPVWVDVYKWDDINKRKDYNVDPRSAEVRANGQPWTKLTAGKKVEAAHEIVHSGGPLTVMVEIRANYAISNNFWLDGWSLSRLPDVPTPPVIYPIGIAFTTPNGDDGPMMVIRTDAGEHAGATEDVQLQPKDRRIVKNRNYERIWVEGNWIYRDEDTSHGEYTFYTLQDNPGSRAHQWLPSHMEIGKVYKRIALVRIFSKNNCAQTVASYYDTTYAILRRVWNGQLLAKRLMNIFEVEVSHNANGSSPFERYWYAEGLGLVQWWDLSSGAHSIVVDFPQGRARLVPDEISCL